MKALAALLLLAGPERVPYVLFQRAQAPRHVVILFPGGDGKLDARLEDGRARFGKPKTFSMRLRGLLVDDEFSAAAMDGHWAQSPARAVIADLKTRFPGAKLWLLSTSRTTYSSLRLAPVLQDELAGMIHSSSFEEWVATFDGRKLRNRQLLLHHEDDGCPRTPYAGAKASHDRFGTELLTLKGGRDEGDPCGPESHHGFAGLDEEAAAKLKAWMKAAR